MKILLADDSGALGAELSAVLGAGGHEVQLAQDGVTALRAARAWSPALVLAAVDLPRMDGLALTAALGVLGGERPPVVVLCGRPADFHARSRGRTLGVAAYLPLPLDVSALLRVVWRAEKAPEEAAPPPRRRGIPGARRRVS
jgi:DNA-binding response OmpR family regulator